MRAFEALIGIRKRWIVVGLAVVACAFPAGALAKPRDYITTGAVPKAQGFKLTLKLLQGGGTGGYGGRLAPTLDLFLNRTTGSATQVNDYEFNSGKICGSKKKCAKDDPTLRYAVVGATFDKHRGSINMSFHPTGPRYHVNVPKGCGRSGYSRHGKLTGKLTLKADKLGTIKLKSVKATLSTAYRKAICHKTGTLLFGSRGVNTSFGVFAYHIQGASTVREGLYKFSVGATSALIHCYSVTAPFSTGAYTHSADLSSGTINAAGGITGAAAKFSGPKAKHISNGHFTAGGLQAKTAAVGVLSPFASKLTNAFQQTGTIVPITSDPAC
jgi:hypothetical protein